MLGRLGDSLVPGVSHRNGPVSDGVLWWNSFVLYLGFAALIDQCNSGVSEGRWQLAQVEGFSKVESLGRFHTCGAGV